MALTASDLATLRSSLTSWEIFEYSAAGIVLLGVIGEYVAEFTGWAADRGIEKKLSKISTLVLIVGIAGEGIGLFRTNQLSGELIASLEEQSNRAFERAVKAEGSAESAKATAKGFEARIAEANRASAEANARAANAEAQLAEANRKAGEANRKAESFRLDIAKANEGAAKAEQRAAEAELELAKLKLPRTLSSRQQQRLIAKLNGYAGQKFSLARAPPRATFLALTSRLSYDRSLLLLSKAPTRSVYYTVALVGAQEVSWGGVMKTWRLGQLNPRLKGIPA